MNSPAVVGRLERGVRPAAAEAPLLVERLNELPALPTPWVCVRDNDDELVSVWRAFQMRDYARACMCPLLAEIAALREQLARFTPLRAKGVVDADDNLDCWDTNPYEICTRHVAALNEKDPAAMWRVVDLFACDEGPNAGSNRPASAGPVD